jgi:signal peptidase I
MENTFLIGDFIVVSKVAYGATLPFTDVRTPGITSPRRGDIVVFRSNHDVPPEPIVKRLIGEPGDTLEMRAGTVFVNGSPLNEPYAQHIDPTGDDVVDAALLWQRRHLVQGTHSDEYFPSRENWGPIVVPGGTYFMLGDNRDKSNDSRYWGFVTREEIIGRAEVIYFSKGKGLPVRWRRIGRRAR